MAYVPEKKAKRVVCRVGRKVTPLVTVCGGIARKGRRNYAVFSITRPSLRRTLPSVDETPTTAARKGPRQVRKVCNGRPSSRSTGRSMCTVGTTKGVRVPRCSCRHVDVRGAAISSGRRKHSLTCTGTKTETNLETHAHVFGIIGGGNTLTLSRQVK